MDQNLQAPLRPGECPRWCTQEHTPGEQIVVHMAVFQFSGNIEIVWLQAERYGVVHAPSVRIDHPAGDRRRYLEWRPEKAADVGDLLAAIRVQDIADIAARLAASFDVLGRTL